MENEMRKDIDKVKNWKSFLNENVEGVNITKNDWNSVMTNLEKIENIGRDAKNVSKFITNISNRQGYYCEIRIRESYDDKIADGWGDTKIESIYNCIIDFYKNNDGNF